MKYFRALLLLALGLTATASAEVYQQVRVVFGGPAGHARLLRTGLSFEEGVRWHPDAAELIVSETERRKLEAAGFPVTVLEPDVASFYASRLQRTPRAPFAVGSMGGFLTFSEALAKLQSLNQAYKGLISAPMEIGKSVEGRPILAIKISDNVAVDEDEPEILYTALHHAREPQSLMCLLHFMEKLLQGYGKNPQITYVIQNRELWFIPVVNPDGYVYNEQTNPSGGGMWRKNRRVNPDRSVGVDLNRNYGYQWGYDDLGSSPTGEDEVYRGPAAFSEPETAAIRNFVKQRNLITALNYHSYRDALIYSWNFANQLTAQDLIFREMATFLTRVNGYSTGNSTRVLRYTANGEAGDWFYGDIDGKNRIFAMTPEVGNSSDGFWPAGNRILELSKENFGPNLELAMIAGGFPIVRFAEYSAYPGGGVTRFKPGNRIQIKLTVRNLGLSQPVNKVTARLKSLSKMATVESDLVDFGTIAAVRNKTKAGLRFQISPQAKSNLQIPFDLSIYLDGVFSRKDRIYIRTQ